ncbi:MAG: hypothetical protein JO021_00450 [Alphaproteobacteria bacterium]|nr:hypothetical protein [Alphaproteobacteria bacterium]
MWRRQAGRQYGAPREASALDAETVDRQRERYRHWLPRWIEHGDGRGWPAFLGKPPTDRACPARPALGDVAVDEAVAERAPRAGATGGEPI